MSTDFSVWRDHAGDLAEHAYQYCVNRGDAFGAYRNGRGTTVKKPLTRDILQGRFEGKWTIGLHALSGDNHCKWLAFDVDNHNGGDPHNTERYAIKLHNALDELGLEPSLLSADGRGSFHVIVIFERSVPGTACVAFAKWILSEWKDSELKAEHFPKQATAEYGSWLRLWGRHPKHQDHWHRVWSEEGWLNATGTVDTILRIEGADPGPVLDKNHQIPGIAWTDVRHCNALPAKELRYGLNPPPSDKTQAIIENGANPGERNNKLFAAAADLAGRGYAEDDILEELLPSMSRSGLSEREIRTTVHSAGSHPLRDRLLVFLMALG